MIRLSMLRNCPVVCQDRKIGLLQSVSMDKAQKRVAALIVSCGFSGKKQVLPQDILSLTEGYILIRQAMRLKRPAQHSSFPLIRDTTGMLAGRIIDYAIDECTLCICAVEMAPGYLPFEYRRKLWVYEYSGVNESNEIVIPAGLGREPLCQWEEGEGCESQP